MSEVILKKGGGGNQSARPPHSSRLAHDVFQSVLCRQLQADTIATRQLQRRAFATGVIDRTNRVNDMLPVT